MHTKTKPRLSSRCFMQRDDGLAFMIAYVPEQDSSDAGSMANLADPKAAYVGLVAKRC